MRVLSKILIILFLISIPAHAIPITDLETILSDNNQLGDVGRLYIPTIEVNVALNLTWEKDKTVQLIVDKEDSAAYCPTFFNGCGYIADHWNQSFLYLKDCELGDYAYIKTEDQIRIFQCIKVTTGYNKTEALVTIEDEDIRNITWADFVCYTCNGNSTNVIMRFFKELD